MMITKSKGRGGARKGAGRPRYAKGRTKTSYFSTRISEKTRDLLEAEARLHGESLAVVAEQLLLIGLGEKAERRKKKPVRALSFLMEMLSKNGPYDDDPKYYWLSNPYLFEAFRTSVLRLFDELKPSGEVVPPPRRKSLVVPEILRRQDSTGDPLEWFFPDSPEEYGRRRADVLLLWMQTYSFQHAPPDIETLPPEASLDRDKASREFYGLVDARKDLELKGPLPDWAFTDPLPDSTEKPK